MTLPDGVPGLRPTASRVREAIFDRLGHNLEGERVLDLFAGSGGSARFDLVFVDPPFASPHVFSPILAMLCSARWLAPDARIVCERERIRGAAPNIVIPAALVLDATRTYGQAQVEFLSLAADPEATVDPTAEPDPNAP